MDVCRAAIYMSKYLPLVHTLAGLIALGVWVAAEALGWSVGIEAMSMLALVAGSALPRAPRKG